MWLLRVLGWNFAVGSNNNINVCIQLRACSDIHNVYGWKLSEVMTYLEQSLFSDLNFLDLVNIYNDKNYPCSWSVTASYPKQHGDKDGQYLRPDKSQWLWIFVFILMVKCIGYPLSMQGLHLWWLYPLWKTKGEVVFWVCCFQELKELTAEGLELNQKQILLRLESIHLGNYFSQEWDKNTIP